MLQKLIATSMLVSVIIGLAIMQTTTPATIHPIGLLVFFLCLYVFTLGCVTGLLYIIHRLLRSRYRLLHQSLTLWRAYQLATVIALVPVMLIAMGTVGEVTVLDVVFIVIFVSLALFYIIKRG